jgi:uncharacterized protein YegL
MNPSTRRKLQIVLSMIIIVAAVVLSYHSVVESQTSTSKGPPTDIYLVLDRSGSMGDLSGVSLSTKIEDAKRSAAEFVNIIRPDINGNFTIGLVAFDDEVEVLVTPTHDTSALLSAIGSLTPGDQTAMGDALKLASELLAKESRQGSRRVVLLMSDGLTNSDQFSSPDQAAALATANEIRVYTVAFGSDADTVLLQNIAQRTGGQYYFAGTGAELVGSFSTIARILLTVSPAAHYGSRVMILLALPLVIFLPQIEKGVTRAYEGLTTLLRKQPTALKPYARPRSVCSRCEKSIRPTAIYCPHCGLRLQPAASFKLCQYCGASLRMGARFCTRCGTPFPAESG